MSSGTIVLFFVPAAYPVLAAYLIGIIQESAFRLVALGVWTFLFILLLREIRGTAGTGPLIVTAAVGASYATFFGYGVAHVLKRHVRRATVRLVLSVPLAVASAVSWFVVLAVVACFVGMECFYI